MDYNNPDLVDYQTLIPRLNARPIGHAWTANGNKHITMKYDDCLLEEALQYYTPNLTRDFVLGVVNILLDLGYCPAGRAVKEWEIYDSDTNPYGRKAQYIRHDR